MTPGELLDRVRDFYIDRLSREIREQRAAGRTVIVEPAFRDEDGKLVREGVLDLPARADLVISDGASAVESIQVDTEQMLSFESFSFAWSTALRVECRPFQWNWCEVSLDPAPGVSFPPLGASPSILAPLP